MSKPKNYYSEENSNTDYILIQMKEDATSLFSKTKLYREKRKKAATIKKPVKLFKNKFLKLSFIATISFQQKKIEKFLPLGSQLDCSLMRSSNRTTDNKKCRKTQNANSNIYQQFNKSRKNHKLIAELILLVPWSPTTRIFDCQYTWSPIWSNSFLQFTWRKQKVFEKVQLLITYV